MLRPIKFKIMNMEFNGIKISDVTIRSTIKGDEFDKLITHMSAQDEDTTYDLNVWSYRKGGDCRDGRQSEVVVTLHWIPIFTLWLNFANSECAYVAGAYASNARYIRFKR
jgi:hypothetical protein